MENLSSESEFNLLMSPSRNKKPQRQNTPLKNNSFLEASSSFFDKENQTPKQVPRKESFKSSPFVYPSSNTRLDTNKISERIQNTLTPSRSSRISMQKPQGNKSFVWGTTVDVGECINKFKDFFLNFSLSNRANYDGFSSNDKSPYYIRILEQRRLDGNRIVNLDCVNLLAYPSSVELYDQFLKYPQEIALDVMDFVITNCFRELYRDDPDITDDNSVFKVRPYNVNQVKNMRELDPRDIDKLISIRGFVIRVGNPIPELKVGFFKCNLCQYSLEVSVDDGKIKEPEKCANQNCNGGMGIIHERSKFYNKQVIRLQETPDSVPDGQTPHSVSLVVYDELLDAVKPGDRVEVTGIYRAMPLRLNERQHTLRMFFKTYLDVMHIQTLELLKMESRNSSAIEHLNDKIDDVSIEMLTKIKNLSQKPDIYEILSESLAPSIFEEDDVKKAVLLQLFGGSNNAKKNVKNRGNIHVLLCGDPAMSKSQILQYVHKLSPRGVYTSGKSTSAVGLTAYVTRDSETKQLVLESGALVLSDGGICCIDEFDKMSDGTRSVLHEVMEQQTVSVAKAGIITTLNARTSVLAAANPVHSKWNPRLSVVQNLNMPPSLLSRFDVVFLMLDCPDERRDSKLANHIVNLYLSEPKKADFLVDIETFAAYISYARKMNPLMNDECIDMIVEEYVRWRQTGKDFNNSVGATTRQLEAMIRLSEAHAKMRLSEIVEKEDVHEAIRIIQVAMKSSCTDPETGIVDLDRLTSYTTSSVRKENRDLKAALRKYFSERSNSFESVKKDDLYRFFVQDNGKQQKISELEFTRVVNEVIDSLPLVYMKHNTIYVEKE